MLKFDVKRSMTPQDIAEVTELLDAVEKADAHKPLNDHLWIDLRLGGRAGFAGLTIRRPDTSQPIAYCQVSRVNDSWSLDLVIDPQHRHQTLELGNHLLAEAMQVIHEQGGGHIHWWVFDPTADHQLLAQKVSLTPGRTLLQLRVELPLSESVVAATKNIATQSFKVGIDDEEWIALNNRAFANHPEQGGWTKQILESRQSEKWFDAEGFLMHYINTTDSIAKHELAGFCWTKIDRDSDPLLGEIYVIAVDPRHHNKGLGRSLTVAGLNHLATAGAATGMLFVDKDNIAAISTYLKLGFTTHHQEQAFVGDIN